MFYYIYVLISKKDDKFYIGYCKDLIRRINEHYKGLVIATKNRRPLMLIYYEACLDKYDALKREKYLKSGPGKKYLRKRLTNYLNLLMPRAS